MMERVSRRGLLGKGAAGVAVVAAAAALPSVTHAAVTRSHPSCPCHQATGRRGVVDEEKMAAAWDVLIHAGPDVRAATFAYDQELGIAWMVEYQMIVDRFREHFPGLEIAIQKIADHIIDDCVISQGCECFEGGA